jgi:hypothetical protein
MANSGSRNPLYRAAMMAPEPVAREAYASVMGDRPVAIGGGRYRALAFAFLHAPASVRRALSRSLTSGIEPDSRR